MTGDDRFFFMHIMKTGGTSFQRQAAASIDPAAIYPGPSFCATDTESRMAKVSHEILLGPDGPRPEDVDLYSLHQPLWVRDALQQSLVTVTILRDPIERAISHLRQIGRGQFPGMGLEEAYEYHGRALFRHYQIGQFSLTAEEWHETSERRHEWYYERNHGPGPVDPDGGALPMDDARFERAVDRLRDVDVVATLDSFDLLTSFMVDRFGWASLPPTMKNDAANASGVQELEPVPVGLREQLVRDNELEAEFYAIAQDVSQRLLNRR